MPRRRTHPSVGGRCLNPRCHAIFKNSRSLHLHMSRHAQCSSVIENLQQQITSNTSSSPTSSSTPLLNSTSNYLTQALLQPLLLPPPTTPPHFPNTDIGDSYSPGIASDFGVNLGYVPPTLFPIVRHPDTYIYSKETKIETTLMKILLDLGAPLYGFKSIVKWAKSAKSLDYQFSPSSQTYQSHISHLKTSLQAHYYDPQTVTVELPATDGTIDEIPVVRFDFVTQLFSLLSDPRTNQTHNLVINPIDPFSKYESPNGLLGEYLTGEWYSHAWQHMIDKTNKTFLIPIILYIDKTVSFPFKNSCCFFAH